MTDDSARELQQRNDQKTQFGPRVALGTVVGVMCCLMFAAMLMLMYSLRTGSGGNSLTGDGNGQGTGVGDKVGDGNSSDDDAGGNSDVNLAGDPDAPDEASGGRDGSEVGDDGLKKEPGQHEERSALNEDGQENGAGTATAKNEAERKSFMVAPLENLEKDLSGVAAERKPAAARPPGMFSGRDAESRKQLVASDGGSEGSEAAVELGLKWMAKHQHKDGHWSMTQFPERCDCETGVAQAGPGYEVAATGFGLLPFLGAGYTHRKGKYQSTVKKGLDWLIADQGKDGTFASCFGEGYSQGIGAMALCEAYAMTKDPELKIPAQRAVDYIARAQHKAGGWRYSAGEAGDTSVTGWQVIALKSAQQGGLRVPKEVFPKVSQYLDSVQSDPKGGGYGYQPRHGRSPSMTAEGMLCRIYASGTKRSGLEAGVQYLMTNPPKLSGDFYYWYYATQVLHHHGGKPWKEWNAVMRELLIELQEKDGHKDGSWAPVGGWDAGRVYTTSLALLTLEVYYRHKRAYE